MPRIPWKESNLAQIGTDLDHKIKEAAAAQEEQWQGLGDAAGTKVWRIEQFQVVPWPEEKYGKFHTGDSYIVMHSYKKEGSDALLHDVHIWIGKESSQDEYGTAAYKMVEADESLGGAAIQHRQVQGHESPQFQSYFDGHLTYLEGGVDSGFTHVEEKADAPHLYKIKGTEKGMSMTQVPLKKSSLNEGDSFLLHVNSGKVWVWNGKSANPDEKLRANAQGEKMCTTGTVVTLDQGDGDADDTDFWALIGNDGEIQEADDDDYSVEEFAPLLFQIPAGAASGSGGGDELDDDENEPIQIAKAEGVKSRFGGVLEHKLDRSLLKESEVYLLDAGWEVFLWMGKDADKSSKFAGMALSDVYMKENPRTIDLPLTIVNSGFEMSDFDAFFK